MPIIKSAAKRMRQNAKRATINAKYKREMRTAVKQVTADIANGSKKAADTSFAAAQKAIDKAAKKGILHQNTAARRKSRLARAYTGAFGEAKSTTKKTSTTKPAAKKTAAKKTATKKVTAKKPAKATAKKSTKTATKKTTK